MMVTLIAFIPAFIVWLVGELTKSKFWLTVAAIIASALGAFIGNPIYTLLDLVFVGIAFAIGWHSLNSGKRYVPMQATSRSSEPKKKEGNSDAWSWWWQIALGVVAAHFAVKSWSQSAPKQQVATREHTEEKSIANLNRGLPTMIDKETQLTKVEGDAYSTTYFVRMVNYPSGLLDARFLAISQEIIGRRNCMDKDIRWAYEHDQFMKYIVSGSDNRQAGSFIISKVYCQRFY